jgi:hypothetical protein
MKGFAGITNNDWFAFLSHQLDMNWNTINPFNKNGEKRDSG